MSFDFIFICIIIGLGILISYYCVMFLLNFLIIGLVMAGCGVCELVKYLVLKINRLKTE